MAHEQHIERSMRKKSEGDVLRSSNVEAGGAEENNASGQKESHAQRGDHGK
jgi:hypothetical protein